MSIFTQRTTPEPTDLTMDEAVDLAKRDYARLLHLHDLRWEIDLVGMVRLYCSCSDEAIAPVAIPDHIRKAVTKERGPVRGPNKQK